MWHVPSYHPPLTQPIGHSGSIIAYTIMLLNCSQSSENRPISRAYWQSLRRIYWLKSLPFKARQIRQKSHYILMPWTTPWTLSFPPCFCSKTPFLGAGTSKTRFSTLYQRGPSVEVDQHPRCPDVVDKEFHLFWPGSHLHHISSIW